ncbi:toxic anion resistance protein [Yokenella regensburgei]|uniref:toxic anion resistance protein n=1 Tax=Yokenella regensburgei TaxID=158877 RepID=UPI003F18DEC9
MISRNETSNNNSSDVLITTTKTENITLNESEEKEIESLLDQINFSDPTLSLSWGVKAMAGIANFSDTLMQHVRAKDAGAIGEQLTDLLLHIKRIEPTAFNNKKSVLTRIPLIGHLFESVHRVILDYQTLSQHVEIIVAQLEQAKLALLRDISFLEELFIHNSDYLIQINRYIVAGKKKLSLVKENELPAAQQKVQLTGDASDAQYVTDLVERINRFERRIHDLLLSRTIAIQTAPQIRIIQNNDRSLVEKIQSSILSTIPVWKSQIVLAVALNTQQNAVHLQKDISNATNEMLRKNAQLLNSGSVEIAREVERSVVDIETLREVQTQLINAIESTVSIVDEARVQRTAVEKELVVMEHNLKARLASIAGNQRNANHI